MTLEHDSKSEDNCNLRSAKAGTRATYASHHLMLQYCISCRHGWPEAGLGGSPPQLGGDEPPYKT